MSKCINMDNSESLNNNLGDFKESLESPNPTCPSLPNEILIDIFSRISPHDRLPLTLVCSHWYNVVLTLVKPITCLKDVSRAAESGDILSLLHTDYHYDSWHTAMIEAAKNGHEKIVYWLLNRDHRELNHHVIAAAMIGNLPLLKKKMKEYQRRYACLHDEHEDSNISYGNALYGAGYSGKPQIFYFLDNQWIALPMWQEFLRGACEAGDVKRVRLALKRRIRCNYGHLVAAIKGGKIWIVKQIYSRLSYETRANVYNYVGEAYKQNNEAIMEFFINRRVSFIHGLNGACAKGNMDLVERILSCISTTKKFHIEGAMYFSFKSGNRELIELFLNKGGKVTEDCIIAAIRRGHIKLAKEWIEIAALEEAEKREMVEKEVEEEKETGGLGKKMDKLVEKGKRSEKNDMNGKENGAKNNQIYRTVKFNWSSIFSHSTHLDNVEILEYLFKFIPVKKRQSALNCLLGYACSEGSKRIIMYLADKRVKNCGKCGRSIREHVNRFRW